MDVLGLGDLQMVLPSSALIFFPLMVMDIMIRPTSWMLSVFAAGLAGRLFSRNIMVVVSGEMLHG